LLFDDGWGNNRGVSWRCSLGAFCKENILQKLFGVGPDSFGEYIYMYYKADFDRVLGSHISQDCAHNEWLNTLINLGILGLVAYMGIFITSFKACMNEAKRHPYLYGIAIAIVAYFLHNFFCYQQIICTPTIFILMGMARSVIRFGYGDEETK
ncbi:MAG: O-antigen ligase family protein, partial [Lachnospiraceae bacterium]|nr:O-antigen ligase family protein [Lachnospiraceae bacterium]